MKTKPGTVDLETASFPYAELVGSLLWLARTCRPDIIYAVNQLGSHTKHPSGVHVTAAKRVLRYLKGTKSMGLTLRKQSVLTMEAYSDSDFANEPEENDFPMRSLSGMTIYFRGVGPVYCQSSLQTTISRSTAEAEYRASGECSQKIESFRNLLAEIGLPQECVNRVFEDNEACMAIATNKLSGSKIRHIKIDYHYIRQLIAERVIRLEPCNTKKMVADIFTKALPKDQFVYLRDRLLGGL